MNKLTVGSGENSGWLDDPNKSVMLNSPVAGAEVVAGGVATVLGVGVGSTAAAGTEGGIAGVTTACGCG